MPFRTDPWPTGTPCWLDLAVADVAAAKEFYGAVFGWSFFDSGEEFGHYQIAQVDGRAAAAIGPPMAAGQPTAWTVYVASDDVDGTAKTITESGGTVVAPPFDVAGNGRMTVALDSQGASFGVWQAGGTIGAEVYNEPGALSWTDVSVPDPDAGRKFYAAVFGYQFEPVPGAPDDYATLNLGGAPVGGIGGLSQLPPGTPPHWLAYIGVVDADTAAAAATAAGGSLPSEPVDTPFGRMVWITDPFGATIVAVGPAPAE